MIHRAILAGSIHGLEYDDETVGILGIQLFLQVLHFFNDLREIKRFHLCLVNDHIAGRGIFLQIDFGAFLDTIPINIHFSIFDFIHHSILLSIRITLSLLL